MAFFEKDKKDFNDLVIERFLEVYNSASNLTEAKETLEQMFPEYDVIVFVDRGGRMVLSVGDVTITPIYDVGGVRINVGSAKQQNVDNVCNDVEKASNSLRGQRLTLEQWEQVRQTWISFAKTFTPCHPKYWQKGEVINSEFNFNHAMDLLK